MIHWLFAGFYLEVRFTKSGGSAAEHARRIQDRISAVLSTVRRTKVPVQRSEQIYLNMAKNDAHPVE